jgi:hypothetical protein
MSPKHRALLATVTGLVLAGSGLQIAAGTAAYASPAPAVTLVGSAGHLPAASAVVLVEAEITGPWTRASRLHTVPRYLNDVIVARALIRRSRFSIPVAWSPALRQAAQGNHGTVNFNIIVDSGPHTTALGVPVPVTAQAQTGNLAAAAVERKKVFSVPRLPRYRAMSMRQWRLVDGTRDPTVCHWSRTGGPWEKTTPIGQAHVATSAKITDEYELSYTDDLYVDFGGSSSFNGGFQAVGHIQLDYHWGTTGGGTLGGTSAGFSKYLASQYKWQRYFNNGAASCPWYYYREQSVEGFQNILREKKAPYDPFGGCKHHPLEVTLEAGFHWGRDRGKSQTVSVGTTAFGMGIVGGDGFTNDVNQDWTAKAGAPTSYICGKGDPTSARILWDTLH